MSLPNKDEVEGKWDQAKGKVKESVGRAIDDDELEAEGRADHAAAKLRKASGRPEGKSETRSRTSATR